MIGMPPKRRHTGTLLICFVMWSHVNLQPRRVNDGPRELQSSWVNLPLFTGTNEPDIWSRALVEECPCPNSPAWTTLSLSSTFLFRFRCSKPNFDNVGAYRDQQRAEPSRRYRP